MIKKIVSSLIIILLILPLNVIADDENEKVDFSWVEEVIETSCQEEKLAIQSKYGIVYDRNSKTILWGKNENQRTPMASTTKIMTAIILLENNDNLEEEVEVCKEAANIGGSRLGLKKGDKIKLEDLLYGLMLCSGNDAAIQISVSLCGSIESFVNLMNEKAQELNLKDTHFTSPHGLDNDNHYTTAYEMAKIADYALNMDEFAKVVSTKNYNVKINGYEKNITNTNELLGYFNGVNGVKTGFTNNAGRCLVTSSSKDSFDIITVVLGADTKKIRTKDTIKMINYIYNNYEIVNINEKVNEEYNKWKKINEKRIYVDKGEKNYIETYIEEYNLSKYPIKNEYLNNININVFNLDYLKAPIEKDKIVGKINVFVGDKVIGEINLKVKENIDKKDILQYFNEMIKNQVNYFHIPDLFFF